MATLLLVTANIAAAFAVLLNPELINQFGFNPATPGIQTAFTSLFLHANAFHLLGNMLFLAAVGSAVEVSTGLVRYLTVYFLCGLAGVLLHFAFTRHMSQPAVVIGASGSVAGCVGYFALRYRTVKIDFLPKLSLPVYAVTMVWLAFQGIGAVVNIGADGGTAFWSHLGGFGFGVILSLVFRTPDFRLRAEGRDRVTQAAQQSPMAVKLSAEQHLTKHPHDQEVLEQLADACRDAGEDAAEIDALIRLQALQADADRSETLARIWALGGLTLIPTMERQRLSDRLADASPRTARFLLESIVDESADAALPDALLYLAAFEKDRRPDQFRRLVKRLLGDFPLSPAADLARKRGWDS